MNNRAQSGFTLIELIIVLGMAGVLIPSLIGIYLLPLRTQVTLSEVTVTTMSLTKIQQHLSEDVRCADEIAVESPGDGNQRLFIKTAAGMIRYRNDDDGLLVRQTEGAIPLTFRFPNVRAEFSVDETRRFKALQVRLTAVYDLLRQTVEQVEERTFCSHLEGQP